MKKVLVINASLRKKTTYSLLNRLTTFLKDYEVEFVNIKDYSILPCVGCENCIRSGECFIKDDANQLLTKMTEADGIVIGTPVYLRQISGYLKLLIDRGCAWYHRSPLVGKPIFFVVTTQATGIKQASNYLDDIAVQWGAINAGTISRTMFKIEDPISSKALDRFTQYIEPENKKTYKPKLKNIIEFNTQKVLATHILPADFEFWKEKGYFDRSYYFDCNVNVIKRSIGALYFKMLSYFIGKNKTDTNHPA